ncbi:MAG: alpha/beta fold hydrolase, partial [Candidatus Atribacteria bacterium]
MKLFCRKYGSGPPLIILHGLYGSSDNWVSVARSISDRFTVYLPDQRNHGQSPHSH